MDDDEQPDMRALWRAIGAEADACAATSISLIDDASCILTDAHGDEYRSKTVLRRLEIDALLGVLERLASDRDKTLEGATASRMIGDGFSFHMLDVPFARQRMVRVRRWPSASSWETLIPVDVSNDG